MSSRIVKSLAGAAVVLAAAAPLLYQWAFAVTAFDPKDQPTGYVGQNELTNYNLRSGNEVLFRGEYEREFWSGSLLAYRLDSAGNLRGGSAWWSSDAGELISKQNFDTGRLIGTLKDDGTKVPFRFDSLSATQKGYLTSADELNFLRGDRSNEGSTMRQRTSVMGDVMHSRPYYVADSVNPTVFVGANDGMLHAINAGPDAVSGGRERWAYVPSMLMPKLKNLTADPYVHDFYVDGQINVATVGIDNKRILVGGLGGGGKGLFALNITSLTAANEQEVADKLLWEITPTRRNYAVPASPNQNGFVNLGYTYGTPIVVSVRVGGTEVDAVIIGNGYNDGTGNYSTCTDGSPSYATCGGNYAAYLYVINAVTGELIQAYKAGSNGNAVSPNGLSTPSAVDSDGDGSVDRVYAGDLNGTMWKFDLTKNAGDASAVTALLTTSPAQPITMTPGVALHPLGGYMVNFGTGKLMTTADTNDTSVFYAYGVWDGAPAANTQMVVQELKESERDYVNGGNTIRARRVTSNQPNWGAGASNHKGWKLALPGGERVLGEGSFIESGRFYFTGSNPTVKTAVPDTTTVVRGSAWLMELDYLSGGSTNVPFLDFSGDQILDDQDRFKYTEADTLPAGAKVGDPIRTTDGIPVGKWISIGVLSQPVLVQLVTLNDTLFNQNPDVTVKTVDLDRGVKGGHFDVEIYHGSKVPGNRASATITVGTAGQSAEHPATLGEIKANGLIVVPALSTSDLVKGTDSLTNAEKILANVRSPFQATRSGDVVTIFAPAGAAYNNLSLQVGEGTSQALVPADIKEPAEAPSAGALTITNVARGSSNVRVKCGATDVWGKAGKPGPITANSNSQTKVRLDDLQIQINNLTINGYTTTCTPHKSAPSNDTDELVCNISAPPGVSACSSGFSITDLSKSKNVGPMGGKNAVITKPASGWTNLKPALVTTTFSGGYDAFVSGDRCGSNGSRCQFAEHEHEYDDIFDRTGVNFLNASNPKYNLSNVILSNSTQFKVIAQNQYLNPAVKIHIGNPNYLYNVNAGYVEIKKFQTTGTMDLAAIPTYTLQTIGSLTLNLPTGAFTASNWWESEEAPDVRDGLHPTEYGCATISDDAKTDGNMYQPVDPPVSVTASGNGTRGWTSTTDQTKATGTRHNGALTLQIIKAQTPNTAIEMSVPGRPEYGWRVMAGEFANYVLAEYSIFHHTKHLGLCYGDNNVSFTLYNVQYSNVSWSKTPASDKRSCGSYDTSTTKRCAVDRTPAAGSTDPKIGNLGAGSAVESVTTKVEGDVRTTTIVFVSGLKATIVRTVNKDGSVTIVTDPGDGSKPTVEIIPNKEGTVKPGVADSGPRARNGRISWRELVAP